MRRRKSIYSHGASTAVLRRRQRDLEVLGSLTVQEAATLNAPDLKGIELQPCGATASPCPDLTQIPYDLLKLLAKRFEYGELKHGRNNWRKGIGDRQYTIGRINHIVRHCFHLAALLNGEPADETGESALDDAAAVAWGAAYLSVAVPALATSTTPKGAKQ